MTRINMLHSYSKSGTFYLYKGRVYFGAFVLDFIILSDASVILSITCTVQINLKVLYNSSKIYSHLKGYYCTSIKLGQRWSKLVKQRLR